MREKKVIAVIVEGTSDEAALGSLLKEYFSTEEIQFVVVRGDITTMHDVTPDKIRININKLLEETKQKYGYNTSDFMKIIHIVDTDGAFCDDAIVEADVEKVRYYTDHIETKNPNCLEKIHIKKAKNLSKLANVKKINGVAYQIYFNSCNLEHVLFNRLENFTKEQKADMADEFAEKYEGNIDAFIDFISKKDVAVPGNYNDTWRFIKEDTHSLERHSNMHLIFKR